VLLPDNPTYPGYLMGNLMLPPRAIKDPECVGACAQTFTVVSCQPNALEVAYGDPDEDEGVLNPDTAQRFMVGPGDMFRIPPKNCYRLENHSRKKQCILTWTIIRNIELPYDDEEGEVDEEGNDRGGEHAASG
jgi:centromere protein C